MALLPSRTKYRKQMRGVVKGNATRGNFVAFGDAGLQTLEPGWITGRQIEAARIAISRAVGKAGKYWIRVFPHKPVSAKPLETRQGKGKGEPEFWCAVVKPGVVMFEVGGVNIDLAREALAKAANKMPVRCRLVERHHRVG
ncbi:MAG: 50S ribosomal protein L16 [Planctomycetes bacterium]|nr:50S ribosomal protein L16 [Planctomycetota bacterium]